MKKYQIVNKEKKQIESLLNKVAREFESVDSEAYLSQAGLIAHELPFGLREFLHNYKKEEDIYPTAIIQGYDINQERVGKPPLYQDKKTTVSPSHLEDIFFSLCTSLLGHPIGWSTQQSGKIVHDIYPIKKYETDQVGFSSKCLLEWHTEDAFHPLRGDYLCLMCIRNPSLTPTLVASNTDIDCTQEKYNILFEELFLIKPDDSHLCDQITTENEMLINAQKSMNEMNTRPQNVSVFFGSKSSPYWRVDPFLMLDPQDEEARNALHFLIKDINHNLREVVLHSGDILLCDNFRVVHGRPPFEPKYDGWDRWLKRINVSVDLRKSRSSRPTGTSRILY